MATAEHREPCDSRGSCTVLGAPGGAIPLGDSTRTSPSPGSAAAHPQFSALAAIHFRIGFCMGDRRHASRSPSPSNLHPTNAPHPIALPLSKRARQPRHDGQTGGLTPHAAARWGLARARSGAGIPGGARNWLPLTSHPTASAHRANPYACLRKHPGFQPSAKDGDMLSARGSSL
jgi:hypothetical protein